MSFYERRILPCLLDKACAIEPIARQRAKIVPQARGRVLEIGAGSGLNLPFYDSAKVESLTCVEPSREIWARAQPQLAAFPVTHVAAGAEALGAGAGVDDGAFDTVVVTYTLCSMGDALAGLAAMRRAIKPTGTLLFCEHGAAPDANIARWQGRLNPLWKLIAGGCNLNRPIPTLIEASGFAIDTLETMYLPVSPKIAAYNYWGAARAA